MMTEKLFYQDSHLAAFEARVLACGEADKADQAAGRTGYRVELDRTAFFRRAEASMRIQVFSAASG